MNSGDVKKAILRLNEKLSSMPDDELMKLFNEHEEGEFAPLLEASQFVAGLGMEAEALE